MKFTINIVACCLKAGLSEARPSATQRLTIGHVPAEAKTVAVVALKTECSRSEYEQFLGNGSINTLPRIRNNMGR
jgi:hypothetical protein